MGSADATEQIHYPQVQTTPWPQSAKNVNQSMSKSQKAYEVTSEPGQLVIRFDDDLVDRETVSKLLDYVELESIRKRSQLSEEKAGELADEIDRAVWEQIKHEYERA